MSNQFESRIPLDTTTEWIETINRRREYVAQQAEEKRQQEARKREEALQKKAEREESEARQCEEELAIKDQRRHRNKINLCLVIIVLMLLLSVGSFALQYAGYLPFPWSIVITGVFSSIAAFCTGVIWEACRK